MKETSISPAKTQCSSQRSEADSPGGAYGDIEDSRCKVESADRDEDYKSMWEKERRASGMLCVRGRTAESDASAS